MKSQQLETPEALAMLEAGHIWADSVGAENIYFRSRFCFEYYCKCYPQDLEGFTPPRKQALYKTAWIPEIEKYCAIKRAYSSELGFFYTVRIDGNGPDSLMKLHESDLTRFCL